MKGVIKLIFVLLLVYHPCSSRPADDAESVVSVYTTLPTTAGTGAPLDVYQQIASNIADRITSPFYRFFGLANDTNEKTTKRPFEHIELQPDSEPTSPTKGKNDSQPNKTDKNGKTDNKHVTNDIPDRDVEEISIEAVKKPDKKPEKVILFSSYLPVRGKLEKNDTSLELDDVYNEDDDDFDDDNDLAKESPRGPFVYILELMGSIIQLLWGGFLALFRPSTTSSGER